MTLEGAAAAKLRLAVWCKACGHQSEPDLAEQARWYGPATPVPEWRQQAVQADVVARVKCARSPLLPPRIMSRQIVHCSSLVVAPTEGDHREAGHEARMRSGGTVEAPRECGAPRAAGNVLISAAPTRVRPEARSRALNAVAHR